MVAKSFRLFVEVKLTGFRVRIPNWSRFVGHNTTLCRVKIRSPSGLPGSDKNYA